MSATFSVQLEAVQALAAELAALAADLAGDAAQCRATAPSLAAALGGDEGWAAAGIATAWSGLADLVAERAGALAGTLLAAVASYSAADAALADRVAGPLEAVPVPR